MGEVVSLDRMAAILSRTEGQVVFTNGVFDLLHVGHVNYLQQARDLGDVLIVGLNSDASTRAIKGSGRPIVTQHERARVLAALACVDYVVIFDGTTANGVVEALRPDIYVKGGDWGDGHAPPEAKVVEGYGGQVRILPYMAHHSTTRLIEASRARRGDAWYRLSWRDFVDRDKRRDLIEALLVVVLSLLYIPWGLMKFSLRKEKV